MGQLRKKHAHHVTPWTEGSRHGSHTGIARKFRNQMRRNQIAKLSENTEFGCGWFGISFFSPLLSGRVKEPFQPLFLCFN